MEGKRGSECLLKPVLNIDFNPLFYDCFWCNGGMVSFSRCFEWIWICIAYSVDECSGFEEYFLSTTWSGNGNFSSGTDVAYGLGAFMWGVVANFIGFFGMYCLTATMVIATLLLVIAHNRLLNE
ncbi:hypothetical protein [Leuconostoc mesenteroides]|uniref:hypothetical protein n=1 Tax=Leuconostoc mesenteroides TaxID=1245 RepID=UPI001EE4A505|nr:hypothetical protein [Leuconostoc mesenteroides]